MAEFSSACAFTRYTAREVLMLLFDFGLDINYIRPADGLSPLMYAIKTSNLNLLKLLMTVTALDVTMKGQYAPATPASKYY